MQPVTHLSSLPHSHLYLQTLVDAENRNEQVWLCHRHGERCIERSQVRAVAALHCLHSCSFAVNFSGNAGVPDSETVLKRPLPPDYLRSNSGAIEAAGGTLYVSRPFRTSKDKKSKAIVSFVPRTSHFASERSGSNEFRVCALINFMMRER